MVGMKMNRARLSGIWALLALVACAFGFMFVWTGWASAEEASDGEVFFEPEGDIDESQLSDDEVEEAIAAEEEAAEEVADSGAVTLTDSSTATSGSTTLSTLETSTSSSSAGVIYRELEDGMVDYDNIIADTVMQIANEKHNGIYFLNTKKLGFYSLDDYSYSIVYTFDGCDNAYTDGELLYVLDDFECYVYDLDAQTFDHTVSLDGIDEDCSTSAIGADASGRLYVGTQVANTSNYMIWLLSADGEFLSSTEVDKLVRNFIGFDAESGRFYMESNSSFSYWGYDQTGRGLTMGQVEDDQISYLESYSYVTVGGFSWLADSLEYLCQNSYYQHDRGAALLGDGAYLVTASITKGRVLIIDEDSLTTLLSISRSGIEEEQDSTYNDYSSIGVRAVYREENDSFIVYEDGKVLNEYDVDTGEVISSFETEHYVFNLLIMGDQVIAIEKEDGQFYIEIVEWETPTEVSIEAETDNMLVGESQQLSAVFDSSFSSGVTWSSSDDSIVSVTSTGKVSAWSEGEATITCTAAVGGLSDSYTITVTGSTVETPAVFIEELDGKVSDNISDNDISTYYSTTVKSYLYENDDGSLTRVEYLNGSVLVEEYSADHELQSSQTIDAELSLWGGFYAGEDYNYLVFGQDNEDESDSVEVLRVVKYSKSWKRVDSCSIYGANTYEPFEAGSLRMTELDGALYIYTCHTMYAGDDDTNHQSNMTFVIDEDSMEVTDSYYDVANISYGYVSHSFNQFIRTDGENIYRVDLGDGYLRAVSLTVTPVGNDVTDLYGYASVLPIEGTVGANATGVSVGGLELSDENCLVVGNSVDQDEDTYSASGQRNIFLTVTGKESLTTSTIWLTDYDEDDGITPRTPQLVKLNDDQFLIMWEEKYDSGNVVTRAVTVNGEGTITSEAVLSGFRLSDCQPITTSEGLVTWYVTDDDDLTLYTINPYDLEEYEVDEEDETGSSSSGSSSSGSSSSSSGSSSSSSSRTYFTDVPASDSSKYYFDAVYAMADAGYVTGYSDGSFGVGDGMTREQVVTILWRMAGEPEASTDAGFSDVKSSGYYAEAVNWAAENDVVEGYSNGEFGVGDAMTFEQMTTIVARYAAGGDAALNEAMTDAQAAKVLAQFTDGSKVSSWADNGMAYLVEEGLVTGNARSDGTLALSPSSTVARERAVTVLNRAVEAGIL